MSANIDITFANVVKHLRQYSFRLVYIGDKDSPESDIAGLVDSLRRDKKIDKRCENHLIDTLVNDAIDVRYLRPVDMKHIISGHTFPVNDFNEQRFYKILKSNNKNRVKNNKKIVYLSEYQISPDCGCGMFFDVANRLRGYGYRIVYLGRSNDPSLDVSVLIDRLDKFDKDKISQQQKYRIAKELLYAVDLRDVPFYKLKETIRRSHGPIETFDREKFDYLFAENP